MNSFIKNQHMALSLDFQLLFNPPQNALKAETLEGSHALLTEETYFL